MVTDPRIIALHAKGPISQAMEGAAEIETHQALDNMGYPEKGRLDVPVRDRHALPHLAELLQGLASDMIAISQAEHLNDFEALRRAYRKVQNVAREMQDISRTPQEWSRGRTTTSGS